MVVVGEGWVGFNTAKASLQLSHSKSTCLSQGRGCSEPVDPDPGLIVGIPKHCEQLGLATEGTLTSPGTIFPLL